MQRNSNNRPASTIRRRQTLIALSVMAVLLLPAAIAWACGPNRQMQCDRLSYSPNAKVTCSGVNFYENMELTFRLDPGGPVGQVVTSGEGTFTFSFNAPAQAGAYTLVAEAYDEQGNYRLGLPARQSFEVVAPAPAPQPGVTPQTPGQNPAATPAPRTPGARDNTPGENSPTRDGRRGADRGGDQGRSPAQPPGNGNGGRRGSSRTGDGSAPAVPPAASGDTGSGATAGTGRGREVFTDSVSRDERTSTAPVGEAAPSPVPSGPEPAEASATGDLWSGFGSGDNPSLLPGADDALAPEADTDAGVTWGLALLGLGLLVLIGTLALAEARRRRASSR